MLVSRVGEAQRIWIHCTIFLMKWIESEQLWRTNEGLCSGRREREMGREGVWFVFLSDYEFLMWRHTCAVSACKYEPFDCIVVSSPWLQVVQPIRTQGKPLFYILVRREHSPTNYSFLFSFLFFSFLDWTRVYLFGNKLCDSVTISMHAFFICFVSQCRCFDLN